MVMGFKERYRRVRDVVISFRTKLGADREPEGPQVSLRGFRWRSMERMTAANELGRSRRNGRLNENR